MGELAKVSDLREAVISARRNMFDSDRQTSSTTDVVSRSSPSEIFVQTFFQDVVPLNGILRRRGTRSVIAQLGYINCHGPTRFRCRIRVPRVQYKYILR
jgi:hypothetical protein